MPTTLRDALLSSGAVVDGASALPLHFGAPKAELHAALHLSVVADRSSHARVLAGGPDLLNLLNRLSTHAVKDLAPGCGAMTVVTTAKGRIVDRLFVSHLGDAGVLLVGGRGRSQEIIEHLDRFTFAEKTGLRDTATEFKLLGLCGPLAHEALATAGFERPQALGALSASFDGCPVYILGHDGEGAERFSILVATAQAGSLWQALVLAVSKHDGRAAGQLALEVARIRRGLPASGSELNADHNPLEAGLWDAVSFDKGCYVGQEVVARLRTYDKVSRRLVGLTIVQGCDSADSGTRLFRDGRAVGAITSVAGFDGVDTVALAYVKNRDAAVGDSVNLGAPDGPQTSLIELPFESASS